MELIKQLATSKKLAIIISYVLLAVHTVSNIILTPLYLNYLGLEQYGLYQMIYTVASYILILDFGIKTTMVRYISMYHAKNDYETEKNFSANCLLLVTATIVSIIGIGLFIDSKLLTIYPSITAEEAKLAHQLFLLMLAVISATIIERFLHGCMAAYEHFVAFNAMSVLRLILKIILTVILLYDGMGVLTIVLVDLGLTGLCIIFSFYYVFKVLKFRIKLERFEFSLILEMLSFMFPIFLQGVIGYINNYVDKTILGIMTTKADVAIYSVGMTFITLFNSLPTVISSVFLPQASKLVHGGNCNREKLTAFVIRPGRYQFMLCAALMGGFIMFGQEFIYLWAGSKAVQAWGIALIIMIPNMIPLIENVILSILNAMKKRLFRSVVLVIISLIHIAISVALIPRYGMIGAPIGTALAFVFGYGIIMNIYYEKEIGIDVLKMFRLIFSRTWVCILVPVLVAVPLNKLFTEYSWNGFLIKAVVFVIIYGLMLLFVGFNEQEKKDISVVTRRFNFGYRN